MKNQIKHHPPLLAQWILKRIFPDNEFYTSLGDFEEVYQRKREKLGLFRAWSWYWRQVCKSFSEYIKNQIFWSFEMIKNYLKIALRNIKRQKIYTFINVFGLAVGMACCLVIFLFVQHEFSYDNFHEKADRIYRLCSILQLDIGEKPYAQLFDIYGPEVKEEFPEIEETVRIDWGGKRIVAHDDNIFMTKLIFADPQIFNVFTFPFVKGHSKTALIEPNSIVISEETAKKIFGNEDPVGKTLKLDRKHLLTITGVIKNIPQNSHLQFDAVGTLKFIQSTSSAGHVLAATYLLVSEHTDAGFLESKFPVYMKKNNHPRNRLFLQPLKSIHLNSNFTLELGKNSHKKYSYYTSLIAVLIVLIACINFMNLSSAKSFSRAKEVGIRKIAGAGKSSLFKQFLMESLLTSFFAILLSIIITYYILPFFNDISSKNLSLDLSKNPFFVIFLIGITIAVGVISGSYPAFLLSSGRPLSVIKGKFKNNFGKLKFRKILVILQYTISVVFITITFLIISQLNFINKKDLKFDKENIILIDTYYNTKKETFKNELLKMPEIKSAGFCSYVPGDELTWIRVIKRQDFNDNNNIKLPVIEVGSDFFKTFNIELISGRDFSKDISSDMDNTVIINETCAKYLGWSNPVGKNISFSDYEGNEDNISRIIGVVRDFHFEPLRKEISAYIFYYNPSLCNKLAVKIHSQNQDNTLTMIKDKWKEFAPDKIFTSSFIEEKLGTAYKEEKRYGRVLTFASILTIIIASMGLFGLALYSAETRTKEIGIRKAVGATVLNIIVLLSKEFIKLVLTAGIIAVPIAYYFSNKWLQGFAYRINFGIFLPSLAILISFAIAILTVSYQSIKAARSNPVDTLRYE